MSKRLPPLLRNSIEFLDHGLWHFFRSATSSDMKFALLHVDQAVELILKEKVRALGGSIYKHPKETITVYAAYDFLDKKNCTIPERPDLEILHEERNNVQHKFSNPSPEDAGFMIEKAVMFLKRFYKDELGVAIENHIPQEYLDGIIPKKP
jgi:hypothetical protein